MDTEVLQVDPGKPDPVALARAAEVLRDGGLVAFPTETVYGLGCQGDLAGAVARIYEIKKRPADRPLAVYLADSPNIFDHARHISVEGHRLIERYMPGPVTLIFLDAASTKTGFRVPSHRVAVELIQMAQSPLVGTSANLSGQPSPSSAADVLAALDGRVELVLDAGPTPLGVESTVIDCTSSPPTLVREGAIAADEISTLLGVHLSGHEGPTASSS